MTAYINISILVILLQVLYGSLSPAQESNTNNTAADKQITGLPIIRNYLPAGYDATPQNWAVVKDQRGIMYFANTGGVLEYDGNEWHLIQIKNEVARTLAIDKNGIIYVGGVDEFGYLYPDSYGRMKYKSLVSLLPQKARAFGDIWSIWISDRGVFFQSKSHIFLIKDPMASLLKRSPVNIKTFTSKTIFNPAFYINQRYYVPETGVGLMTLRGDSLTLVPGGERFSEKTIYNMLSYLGPDKSHSVDNKILIGTAESGFYIYDGKSFSRFVTDADEYIKKNFLYFRGGILQNNTYVFGTQTGGIIILSNKGKLLQVINKNNGLSDNTAWFVYPDESGILWVGMNNGIAKIIYPSPLTLIDSRFGIDGIISFVSEHKGNLYLSTPKGIYYSSGNEGNISSRFKLVEGLNSESWDILDLGDYQLAATTHGLYRIQNNKAVIINTGWRFAYAFCRSKIKPDIIYVGLHDGLAKIKLTNGEWKDDGRIPGVNEIITQVVEETDGVLWLSSYNKGLIRIVPDYQGNNTSYTISKHDKDLPGKRFPFIVSGNKMILGTANGLMNFKSDSNKFTYDPEFGQYFKNDFTVSDIKNDAEGNIWIAGFKDNNPEFGRIIPDGENHFKWEQFPQLKIIIDRLSAYSQVKLFPDKYNQNLMWITNGERLYRFDLDQTYMHKKQKDFYANIRGVNVSGDSTIYAGGLSMSELEEKEWNLSADINSIEFHYASSSYFHDKSSKYHYSLNGYDSEWSEWTSEDRKEYTNLSPGVYRFNVQAKNILGEESNITSFTFYIPTPWYKSVWAIVLFSLLLISGIWWVINLRFRILEKRNIELEAIVNSRTNEVRRQKDILEEQAAKLLELDRLKSNFFANISHEFRTPLTLIMGQIENLLGKSVDEFTRKKLKTALSNSKQLQALINRLLELTKLESGEFKMKVSYTEINSFLRKIFSAFESLTDRQHKKLELKAPEENIYLYIDREKIEEVFNNLISNAIKFTPENGKITLSIVREAEEPDYIRIYVTDTGIGIEPDYLQHIFDRFYQVDSSQTREYEGTGIGLAIVKELVQLHKGTISVKSTVGTGTQFCVRMPLGKEHFIGEQNVEFVEGATDDKQTDNVEQCDSSGGTEDLIENILEENQTKEVILVVEDNHDMRTYIRENLEEDYKVIEAKNGEEGINNAFKSIPDLIITDVMMPAINGFELTSRLKTDNRTSHIPIIMLTAKADEDSKLRGLDIGVDDYLIKPFSTKELHARVGNLIKLRRLLKERYNEISAINPSEIEAKPIDKEFLERVFGQIKDHIEDPAFTVTKLAEEIGMSVSQLNRKLNGLINQSAGKLIRSTKLDYALQLLKNKAGNISEIAYRVGFSDTPSFTHSFKEKFGCAPTEYLKSGK